MPTIDIFFYGALVLASLSIFVSAAVCYALVRRAPPAE
jgi:hypothetical protein